MTGPSAATPTAAATPADWPTYQSNGVRTGLATDFPPVGSGLSKAWSAALDVLGYAAEHDAISFDAPGARYAHRDGKRSFKTLVDEDKITDAAVLLMAKVVHGGDMTEDLEKTPESAGLMAIANGFAKLELDGLRQLELELPVYDVLYAWAPEHVGSS